MPQKRLSLCHRTLALITFAQCFSLSAFAATPCHVTPNGTPVANGWSTTTTLHAALADNACQEIWVARGVYRPSTSGDKNAHFAINRPLRLYGGFTGTETTLAQRRLSADSAAQSILSGDLNGDDEAAPSENNRTDNSHNVLVIGGTDMAQGNGTYTANEGNPTYTVVDGFTLQGGDALGGTGAGLQCNGAGTGRECSPLLQHLTFRHNRAAYGAALFNNGEGGRSNPVIRYSLFEYNRASSDGGAIYNLGSINPASAAGEARPTISHSTFHNNLAGQGSAIYNIGYGKGHAHPVIEFSTLTNTLNTGMLLFNNAYAVSADNTSTFGAYATVTGSIVWGAGSSSSQSYVKADQPKAGINVTHSIFKVGVDPYVYNNGGLINVDPLLGALQDNGGATRSALPAAASPAVEGYGACPSVGLTDQRGVARPDGVSCDLGAVERIVTARTLQVTVTGQGSVTGDATHAASLQCETGNTGTCTTSHGEGTLLPTLTATPAPGYRFAGWSGDCTAASGTCSLFMKTDRSATAKFAWIEHTGTIGGQDATASLDSDSTCEFDNAEFAAASAPAGFKMPYGQFSFRATNCTPGDDLSVTLTLPETLPTGATLRKFIAGQGWIEWPATITGDTVTYTVTDAQQATETGQSTGDSNATPGTIEDPVALAWPLQHAHDGTIGGQDASATLDPNSTCEFESAHFEAASAPAGSQMPYGQFRFSAINCTPGDDLTLTLKFPDIIPANAQLHKFIAGEGWVEWPATISGDTVTYKVKDAVQATETGQSTGDSNAAPGVIDDPVALVLPTPAAVVTPVPSLSHGALLLLALALCALTLRQHRMRRA